MIAVLANEEEYPAVREFFELFKTPWEFYRDDRRYDVLICCDDRFPQSSCRLVLIYGSSPRTIDRATGITIGSKRSGALLSTQRDKIPIYRECATFNSLGTPLLTDDRTQHPAALEFTADGRKLVRFGFDLFQEIRHLLTLGQPPSHAHIPALELHIALLRDLIIGCSISLVEIPPVPEGYSFIACLTHDMDHVGVRNHKCDHTLFGFLYRAILGSLINVCRNRMSLRQLLTNWAAALSLPFVHCGLAKDFWLQFDRYLEIERGLTSTFFVIPRKGDPGQDASGLRHSKRSARYDLAGIADQLHRLRSAGREIGLHGIDAWRDSAKGREELAMVSRVTSEEEIGVRMHWLYFDEMSPVILEKAGFSYDSTSGYNETVGYRAGTTQAFKPLATTRMLELPMHIMDTALFYPDYMDCSPKEAKAVIRPLLDNAVRFGGVMTVNWHDRSIAPERLWEESYVDLLSDLKRRGAWFATAAQTVSWFRKRRSAIFEWDTQGSEEMRVKTPLNGSDPALPGLRMRVHEAHPRPNGRAKEPHHDGEFVDVAFDRAGKMQIAQ